MNLIIQIKLPTLSQLHHDYLLALPAMSIVKEKYSYSVINSRKRQRFLFSLFLFLLSLLCFFLYVPFHASNNEGDLINWPAQAFSISHLVPYNTCVHTHTHWHTGCFYFILFSSFNLIFISFFCIISVIYSVSSAAINRKNTRIN